MTEPQIATEPQEQEQQEQEQHKQEPQDQGIAVRDKILVDTAELAKLLGVSCKTIARSNSRGDLPSPVRIGRCLRWSVAELTAWTNHGSPPRNKWEPVWRGLVDAHRN